MRYILVPETVTLSNPITDEPIQGDDARYTFAKSVRTALFGAQRKGAHDILSLLDIRKKIDRAKAGDVVELSEDEWKALEPEFKRPDPNIFTPAWAFAAETHQRAWLDARTKSTITRGGPIEQGE